MSTKIRPIEVSFMRSIEGTFLYMKSQVMEDEAKRYAQGNDDPDTYYIPRTNSDRTFLFNVNPENIGGEEAHRLLRTKGLGEGIKLKINRPVSKELASTIVNVIKDAVKTHVTNHMSAYKVTAIVEMEESVVKWTETRSSTTSPLLPPEHIEEIAMRFKMLIGCWDGSARPLFFILDSVRNLIVWWYKDEAEAVESTRLLNKGEGGR